jgi:hypothetical protein
MAARDRFKKRSFKKFTIDGWDTDGQEVSVRAFSDVEEDTIDKVRPDFAEKENQTPAEIAIEKQARMNFFATICAIALGDEKGERIYQSTPEDIAEIRNDIPAFVVIRVAQIAQEYNAEFLKKA